MSRRSVSWFLGLILTFGVSGPTAALPELYDQLCLSCHVDDTPTCAGCHSHSSEPKATTDRPAYYPGEEVQVTLEGATQPGWIRGLLYDDQGEELARVTGPTGTGDDGTGPALEDSVIVPLRFTASAPRDPGTYIWRAAFFGVVNFQQVTHDETWVPLTLRVLDPDSASTRIEDTWGRIKGIYIPTGP
jgi:hypothetical protein